MEVVAQGLSDSRVRDPILAIIALRGKPSAAELGSQFGSSGSVVESLPLAMYAASEVDRIPFNDVLRNAIEAGGDTETIASMSGQIAGAWLGVSRMPRELIEKHPTSTYIQRVTEQFARTFHNE